MAFSLPWKGLELALVSPPPPMLPLSSPLFFARSLLARFVSLFVRFSPPVLPPRWPLPPLFVRAGPAVHPRPGLRPCLPRHRVSPFPVPALLRQAWLLRRRSWGQQIQGVAVAAVEVAAGALSLGGILFGALRACSNITSCLRKPPRCRKACFCSEIEGERSQCERRQPAYLPFGFHGFPAEKF